MLVFTRKVGESIVIDKNIVVKLIEIGEGRIKIGIEAPREISINRTEIHNKIINNQKTLRIN
jgi:carbon storage regulator